MDRLTRLLLDARSGGEPALEHPVTALAAAETAGCTELRRPPPTTGCSMNRTITVLAVLAVGLVPACGADDSAAEIELPPAAAEGRDVVRSKGCAACHGSNGEGVVGPPFVGLFGSEVTLQGGESVIADREYVVESIVDPDAELVEGYDLPMPRTELSDGEIDAVVAYIEALAEVAP